MKTTLNLALPTSARERYALAWAVPVAAIGLIVFVILIASAKTNYQSMRRARATLADAQREEAHVRAQEAAIKQELDRPQLREVYRYSRFINGVIGRREFSILHFVEILTPLLPGDVRLDGLDLEVASAARVVRLAVSAEKEESLERFIANLEDSPDFADVNIISHGLPEEGPYGAEPATMACQVVYVGGGARTQ